MLPGDVAWPRSVSYGPLSFVADVDCGQLPSDTLSLPRSGTLSFFAHSELPAIGVAPENLAVACVIFTPANTTVAEREPPAGAYSYDLVELAGELHATGPAWDSPVFREAVADLAEDDRAFLDDWPNADPFRQEMAQAAPQLARHRIGGHAFPVQGSVELDVAYAQLGGEVPYGDPAMHREALRWTMLAQFGSEHWARMMWGDCGTLYWLIQPADLAARKFQATSFTWQCT